LSIRKTKETEELIVVMFHKLKQNWKK